MLTLYMVLETVLQHNTGKVPTLCAVMAKVHKIVLEDRSKDTLVSQEHNSHDVQSLFNILQSQHSSIKFFNSSGQNVKNKKV